MDQGVSTLLGALAGSVATFGGVVFGQARLDDRERGQETQRAADAALISARILQGELAWAEARIQQALKNGRYWSSRYALTQEAWLAYREQMAIALDDPDDWSRVRDGYRALHTAELQASRRRTDETDQAQLSDWGRGELESGLRRVTLAIEVLRPIAKDRRRDAVATDPAATEAEPSIEFESV